MCVRSNDRIDPEVRSGVLEGSPERSQSVYQRGSEGPRGVPEGFQRGPEGPREGPRGVLRAPRDAGRVDSDENRPELEVLSKERCDSERYMWSNVVTCGQMWPIVQILISFCGPR